MGTFNTNLLRMVREFSPNETDPRRIVAKRIISDWIFDTITNDKKSEQCTVYKLEVAKNIVPRAWYFDPSLDFMLNINFASAFNDLSLFCTYPSADSLLIQYTPTVSLMITTSSHPNCYRGYYVSNTFDEVPDKAVKGIWEVACIPIQEYYG